MSGRKGLAARLGQSFNAAGVALFARLLLSERHLALPHMSVPDFRWVDWAALRKAGFEGVVLDKDNTITAPYETAVWSNLKPSLEESVSVFNGKVAVFSNSAGLRQYDPEGRDAQALEALLGLAVIRHESKKPAGDAGDLEKYFNCQASRLVMVGDRYFTDVVYGNRNGLLTIRTAPLTLALEPFVVGQVRRLEDTLVASWINSGLKPKEHPLAPSPLGFVRSAIGIKHSSNSPHGPELRRRRAGSCRRRRGGRRRRRWLRGHPRQPPGSAWRERPNSEARPGAQPPGGQAAGGGDGGARDPWDDAGGGGGSGELIPGGEEEIFMLGRRLRARFPALLGAPYHHSAYAIAATQRCGVGLGLFEGNGSLGVDRFRAFAVTTDTLAHDIHLRFHDKCAAYAASKKAMKAEVARLQARAYADVAASLTKRHPYLSPGAADVASLWLLCKQEAALLDRQDRACALFTASEAAVLEWADDVELHLLKGYGAVVNYRMGVALLRDMVKAMDDAVAADQSERQEATAGTDWQRRVRQRAKLRFAHAETLVPLTCLLGLFLGSPNEVENVKEKLPLPELPNPPVVRTWRGAQVAPFGGNTALILYRCKGSRNQYGQEAFYLNNPTRAPGDVQGATTVAATDSQEDQWKYYVMALHNEQPVVMPACGGPILCPFQDFKVCRVKCPERVAWHAGTLVDGRAVKIGRVIDDDIATKQAADE
eukprot:SM000123S25831  [mRNA]  locus=s123:106895:113303:+ [translate_table: standard]